MENFEKEPKSRWKFFSSNGFILGIVVGFGIGIAVDNLLVAAALAIALGAAWYGGRRMKSRDTQTA